MGNSELSKEPTVIKSVPIRMEGVKVRLFIAKEIYGGKETNVVISMSEDCLLFFYEEDGNKFWGPDDLGGGWYGLDSIQNYDEKDWEYPPVMLDGSVLELGRLYEVKHSTRDVTEDQSNGPRDLFKKCVTHHKACACREAHFSAINRENSQLKKETNELSGLIGHISTSIKECRKMQAVNRA